MLPIFLETAPTGNGVMKIDVRLTLAALMVRSYTGESLLEIEIDHFLGILPKGTKFLGAVQFPVDSLSQPYELYFKNPLLDKVKKVRPIYVLGAGLDDEGRLQQGNILLSIDYLDENGNSLFTY